MAMGRLRHQIPPWLAYALAGCAVTGIYFLLPFNTVEQAVLYDAIGASSVLAVIAGTLLCKTEKWPPWYLFALGLAAFTIGDTIFNLYAYAWNKNPPSPSVADVFYLVGYPFLVAGLGLLILGVGKAERRVGKIDAAILASAFGVVQWIFLMSRLVHSSDPGLRVDGAYTGMDVLLVSGLAVFALTPSWRLLSYRLLAAALVCLLAADEVFATNPDHYGNASWNDTLYLLSYVLWGAAALHPSMARLVRRRAPARPRLSASRLVLARLAGLVQGLDRLRSEERAARGEADFARRLLQEQNEKLREADRMKDEFVALISHDLRTPLTSVMGFLELTLDSDELPQVERGFLEVVDRNAQRLLQLVDDLLFVARLEAGEMDLHFGELDLAQVVRQAVEEAEPRAHAKQIALESDTDSVPAISADRGRMFQLLDNLVGNAIKFTPTGGNVSVRLSREGDLVRLEVEDSGIGIAPEDQRRLFERFFRAANTRDGYVPGTGLGLHIARAIVEAHGGRIAVESSPGVGTCFRVELPLTRAP